MSPWREFEGEYQLTDGNVSHPKKFQLNNIRELNPGDKVILHEAKKGKLNSKPERIITVEIIDDQKAAVIIERFNDEPMVNVGEFDYMGMALQNYALEQNEKGYLTGNHITGEIHYVIKQDIYC